MRFFSRVEHKEHKEMVKVSIRVYISFFLYDLYVLYGKYSLSILYDLYVLYGKYSLQWFFETGSFTFALKK